MRICTFNVNSIRSRLEIVQNLIKEYNIDVLCMQEIKVENEKFPLIDSDFNCIVNGQKRFNGVAVCSKFKIEDVIFDLGIDEARFIYVLINGVHIINIYAPLGDEYQERFNYKMNFYDKLFKFLNRFDLNKDKVIICGDFNISYGDIDVWDAEIWSGKVTHLPEEREVFKRFLDLGFIDIFREVFKNRAIFTFYDYRGGAVYKNQGLRLDYFLITPNLLDKVEKLDILLSVRRKRKPTPSDHVPIILELKDIQ